MNFTRFVYGTQCKSLTLGLVLGIQSCLASAAVAPLSVSGNQVLIGGQVGSLAGNSLFWSNTGWGGEKFYTANTVAWLKNDWKSTLVRASMGVEDDGGYLTDASNKTRVITLVDAAIANDIYAIIDWHTHHAELNKAQAIAFFKEMATKYKDYNNVIYEIYNEPLNTADWSSTIKPYAQDVIAEIRAIDPDNLIIVGTQTWSQDVDKAANDPITGYPNIAYTLHFYAATHKQWLRDKAQTALNKGIALFVTEWGSIEASGNGAVDVSETNAWLSFLRTHNISHANWALNDKMEGASALTPGASGDGGWVNAQLTASGALAKDDILNWPSATGSRLTSSSASTTSASASLSTSSANTSSSSAPLSSSSATSSTTSSASLSSSISSVSSSTAIAPLPTTSGGGKSSGGGSIALDLLIALGFWSWLGLSTRKQNR
jgi:endoglucanase/cellulose 1,4-beta-cellobiosidase